MKLDDYQAKASEFRLPTAFGIPYNVLGLVSEVGELADKLKKDRRDGTITSSEAFALEIGDCLWYLSGLASAYGYTMSEVAQMNIDKLQSRKDRNKLSGSGDYR